MCGWEDRVRGKEEKGLEDSLLIKRCIYRARYRGTREADILVGNMLGKLQQTDDLALWQQFEQLLYFDDADLFAILRGGHTLSAFFAGLTSLLRESLE